MEKQWKRFPTWVLTAGSILADVSAYGRMYWLISESYSTTDWDEAPSAPPPPPPPWLAPPPTTAPEASCPSTFSRRAVTVSRRATRFAIAESKDIVPLTGVVILTGFSSRNVGFQCKNSLGCGFRTLRSFRILRQFANLRTLRQDLRAGCGELGVLRGVLVCTSYCEEYEELTVCCVLCVVLFGRMAARILSQLPRRFTQCARPPKV